MRHRARERIHRRTDSARLDRATLLVAIPPMPLERTDRDRCAPLLDARRPAHALSSFCGPPDSPGLRKVSFRTAAGTQAPTANTGQTRALRSALRAARERGMPALP